MKMILTFESRSIRLNKYACNFEGLKGALNDKDKFYSSLSGKGTSDKEYQHILNVWNKFEIKIMNFKYCTISLGMLHTGGLLWVEYYGLLNQYNFT